ncbi:hypothetical protein V8G54_021125 [Vigna mungo]|uniref:Uncharacterized protein n=1 Tax=Vigna mungo TaxID=3915 RepID=A0AAQ3RU03_VIGMU
MQVHHSRHAHSDWVSCVHFSPSTLQPTIMSASWGRTVKVWNLTNCKLRNTLVGHSGLPRLSCFYPGKHHLVVPKLKELTVNEESIILLSHANLPQDLFPKLNLLLLCQEDEDEDNRKDTLPFDFLLKVAEAS